MRSLARFCQNVAWPWFNNPVNGQGHRRSGSDLRTPGQGLSRETASSMSLSATGLLITVESKGRYVSHS